MAVPHIVEEALGVPVPAVTDVPNGNENARVPDGATSAR